MGVRAITKMLQRLLPDTRGAAAVEYGLIVAAVMLVAPLVFADSGYDPEKDFRPVSEVNRYEFGVAVSSAVPVKQLSHLLAWLRARDRPGAPASMPRHTSRSLSSPDRKMTGVHSPGSASRSSSTLRATMRARMSAAPPGGKPTTRRTGLP